MNTFAVVPHVGIGPVVVEMTPAEVQDALKTESSARRGEQTYFYFRNRLKVCLGAAGRVEYVEASDGKDLFRVLYKGIDVFSTPADDLVAAISREAALDAEHPEFGYSFIFPSLDLSLWRPVIPKNSNGADGRFFATIGIGRTGYYSGG